MQDLLSYYDAELLSYQRGTVVDFIYPSFFKPDSTQRPPCPSHSYATTRLFKSLKLGHSDPYLAISGDSMETTVLTEKLYSICLGSSGYQICLKTVESHLRESSCLATPYFHSSIIALRKSNTAYARKCN